MATWDEGEAPGWETPGWEALTAWATTARAGHDGANRMNVADLLVDSFGRIRQAVHGTVDGLTPEQLGLRPEAGSNSIAWLVWHLTRIEDDHLAAVAQAEQVWTSGGWSERFALPFGQEETGYGHGPDDVAAVIVESGTLLTGYHDAVHEETLRYVTRLTGPELDRIVDTRWDPPVSLGVRLVSVLADGLEHAGQAAYVRGMIERRQAGRAPVRGVPG
ncbi:MAG TPA: DUF664 domain-containing protein [Acidimicrobiales bacterium]|nr:DUF664 domain-containing protein [Acidimicrobiales bacterium]